METKVGKPKAGKSKKRSTCPIACSLDLIGDKWSLLIVRDIHFFGRTRYEEFLSAPEKISTNILADRLRKLEENGLVSKTPYGAHSLRMSYELTEKGRSLAKILRELSAWGLRHLADTALPEKPAAAPAGEPARRR